MASSNPIDKIVDSSDSSSTFKLSNDSATSNNLAVINQVHIDAKSSVSLDPGFIEAQNRLHALLDSIDGNKRKREDDSSATKQINSHGSISLDSSFSDSPLDWTKQLDPSTGVPYYYNHRTHISQWEKPSAFAENIASTASDYSVRATFAKANGSFSASGDNSYWDQVGRPDDRSGRQLSVKLINDSSSAFFDLATFEKNREDAKAKKEFYQKSKSGADWKRYNEEKKLKKQKIKNGWMYDED